MTDGRPDREAATPTGLRLTHVRVLTADFSASYAFYRDVLGLPTQWPDNGSYAELDAGGDTKLALFPRDEMAGDVPLGDPGEGPILVLDAGDVDAAFERLGTLGAAVVDEPHDRPEWGLRVLHVRDPDGNLVELFHDIEWVQE